MYYIDDQQAQAIQSALDWIKQHGSRSSPLGVKMPQPQHAYPPPIAVLLLQDLYGGDRALASVLQKQEEENAWLIELIGVRPYSLIENARFSLKFDRIVMSDGEPNSQELFVVEQIPVFASADEMKRLIIAASGGLFNQDKISVTMGNPFIHENLIKAPKEKHEDLLVVEGFGDEPVSPIGQWIVRFMYEGEGILDVVSHVSESDNMPLLTAIATRKTKDMPTDQLVIVHDRFYMARHSPTTAGSIAICLWFPGWGYCPISVGPRDYPNPPLLLG